MGHRGPKPTPSKILRARGSRLVAEREDEVSPPPPKTAYAPRWLSAEGRVEWRRLAPKLQGCGLLAEVDANALERYCETLALWRRARRQIELNGETYTLQTKAGTETRDRPEVKRLLALETALSRFDAKFGLSPADRVGLPAAEKKPEKPAGKSRFFGKRTG